MRFAKKNEGTLNGKFEAINNMPQKIICDIYKKGKMDI